MSGVEFVRRHLRHVQPAKLRAVRYYGYHHPAAKARRQLVQQGSGAAVTISSLGECTEPESPDPQPKTATRNSLCPCCQQPMELIARIQPAWSRGALWQPVQGRAPPPQKKGEPRP